MKLNLPVRLVFIAVLSLSISESFSQSANAKKSTLDLLTGRWSFVKFDWPNFVPDTARIRKDANKQFKDAIYTFTKDGKLIISQSYKPKGYSQNLTYILKNNKLYITPVGKKQPPQIMEIDRLDNEFFVFYVEGSDPTGTFKRLK